MVRRLTMLATALAIALPAQAQGHGKLGTLQPGRYLCELPGDAAGPASRPVEGAWFDIINAGTYAAANGRGTYLRTGEKVTFTRGPLKGARFERRSDQTLRRLDLPGEMAKLRCVRTGRGSSR